MSHGRDGDDRVALLSFVCAVGVNLIFGLWLRLRVNPVCTCTSVKFMNSRGASGQR
jgi:hypothetical protein